MWMLESREYIASEHQLDGVIPAGYLNISDLKEKESEEFL